MGYMPPLQTIWTLEKGIPPLISSAKEISTRPFQPQSSETAVNVHDKYRYNYYTDLSDVIAIVLFMTVLAQVHFFFKLKVSGSLNFKGV
jgi:hypothetical protein